MATKKSSQRPPVLFSIDLIPLDELKAGTLSDKLHEEFTDHGTPLSPGATIQPLEEDKRWQVTDGDPQYLVEKVGQSLNIYSKTTAIAKKKSSQQPPVSFPLDLRFLDELKPGPVSDPLRKEFTNHGIPLSPEATIQPLEADKSWQVTDGYHQYLIEKAERWLNIYYSSLILLLPEMYARWTVDCVIEVAHSVSLDFVSCPQHYRLVPHSIAEILEDFKALTGKRPDWPNFHQRRDIYKAFVGDSDGKRDTDRTAQFHQDSIAFREAAINFVKRIYDTGEDMLRRAFIDEEVTLRSYLNTLEGQVLTVGYTQTGAIFGKAVNVLRSEEVARAFGLPPAPGGDWPLKGTYDGNGAYLVQYITEKLKPETTGLVMQHQFILMQRIACYGPQAIIGALNDRPGWDFKYPTRQRIESAYSWATALRDINQLVT